MALDYSLKKCPFCEGPAEAVVHPDKSLTFIIRCKKCRAEINYVSTFYNQNEMYFDDVVKCMDKLVIQWNQRAN